MNRRKFLGAAAALSSLPLTQATTDGGQADFPKQRYGSTTVVETGGGLEVHSEAPQHTEIRVSTHPEAIGLQLITASGRIHATLLPEDVAELCEELIDARARLDSKAVQYTREWINDEFRSGGWAMNRRDVLQTLGALAAVEWAGDGLDPATPEDWNLPDHRDVNEVGVEAYRTHVNSPVAAIAVEEGTYHDGSVFNDRLAGVYHSHEAVTLTAEGTGEDTDASVAVDLTPEQARELAVALYMAAEEFEVREDS